MLTKSQIDSECQKLKRWYEVHYPLCLYCGHKTNRGDLSHIIRRSYSRELQTVKLNTGLACRACHQIWDDEPDQQIYLPRIIEILYIVYLLDEQYFNLIAGNFEDLAHVLQLFPSVEYRNIQHHGEITQLNYLYQ